MGRRRDYKRMMRANGAYGGYGYSSGYGAAGYPVFGAGIVPILGAGLVAIGAIAILRKIKQRRAMAVASQYGYTAAPTRAWGWRNAARNLKRWGAAKVPIAAPLVREDVTTSTTTTTVSSPEVVRKVRRPIPYAQAVPVAQPVQYVQQPVQKRKVFAPLAAGALAASLLRKKKTQPTVITQQPTAFAAETTTTTTTTSTTTSPEVVRRTRRVAPIVQPAQIPVQQRRHPKLGVVAPLAGAALVGAALSKGRKKKINTVPAVVSPQRNIVEEDITDTTTTTTSDTEAYVNVRRPSRGHKKKAIVMSGSTTTTTTTTEEEIQYVPQRRRGLFRRRY